MNAHFIVFSGYNERAVLSFLRVLTANDASFSIIANGQTDRIFFTPYRDRVAFVRETPQLDASIFDILRNVREGTPSRQHVIAPSTEALNRFFLRHSRECERTGLVIPLVNEDLYSVISNKYSFTQLCARHGFDIPPETDAPETASVPFVAKPKSYGNGSFLVPVLLMTEEDRLTFLRTADTNLYFYQRFVSGRSFYLLMYIARDGNIATFSQENLIQQPGGKSIIAARASTMHTSPLQKRYADFLRKLGFFGFIMIELRECAGRYFMIEANPRFWGPSQLFVDAMECNLFQYFLQDYGVPCASRSTLLTDRYYWHEGFQIPSELSAQLAFHNYSWEEYMTDMPSWIQADIYRRKDSTEIFKQIITRSASEHD